LKIETRKVRKSRLSEVDFDHLSFGETFSDHMFQMDYANGAWQQPMIVPFGKIEVLPSLSTLHYGQSVFEGLKAFRAKNGGINVFRPDKHAERMWHSSDRLCIPRVDKDVFIGAIDALVMLDYK
jgi:branched-chain amino acid aminotransferase